MDGVKDGLGPVFNAPRVCPATTARPAGGAVRRWRRGSAPGPTAFTTTCSRSAVRRSRSTAIGPVSGTKVVFVAEVVPPQAMGRSWPLGGPTRLFGLGLVDAVPDQALLELAMMQQRAAPAIAGHRTSSATSHGSAGVGSFGWKAQAANLFDFAVQAYKDEIGVTTAGTPSPGSTNRSGQPIVFPFFAADDGRLVSEENPPRGTSRSWSSTPTPVRTSRTIRTPSIS